MRSDEDRDKKSPFDYDIATESQINSAMVHASFVLETENGKNARYEDRLHRDLLTTYRDEVKEIWRIAEEEVEENIIEKSNIEPSLAIFCRYPLIWASVAEWGGHFSSDLVIALVDAGLKPYEWGKAAENLFNDASERLWVASTLARNLQEPEKTKAFRTILRRLNEEVDVNDEEDLVWLIEEIAPVFPKVLLPELIEAIKDWHKDQAASVQDWRGARSRALATLLPFLAKSDRPHILQECLKLARAVPNSLGHAITLSMVLPFLSKREQDAIGDECIRSISKGALGPGLDYHMIAGTGKILPRLAEYVDPQFFETLLNILKKDEVSRNYEGDLLYSDICCYLAEKSNLSRPSSIFNLQKDQLRLMMINIYFSLIKDEERQTTTLVHMLPFVQPRALPLILTPPEKYQTFTARQAFMLTRISPVELYDSVLTRVRALRKNSSEPLLTLISLLPFLSPASQEQAKKDIDELIGEENRSKRIEYLVALSKHVPQTQRNELLKKALSLVRAEDEGALLALDIVCSTLLDTAIFRRIHLEELLTFYPREGKCCLFIVIGLLPSNLMQVAWEIIQAFDAENPYLLARWISRITEFGEIEKAHNHLCELLPRLNERNLALFLGALPGLLIDQNVVDLLVERIVTIEDEGAVFNILPILDLNEVADRLQELSIKRLEEWVQSRSPQWRSDVHLHSYVMSRLLPCSARLGYIDDAYQQVDMLEDYGDRARAMAQIAYYADGLTRFRYLKKVWEYIEAAKKPENMSETIRQMHEVFGSMKGTAKYEDASRVPDAKVLVFLARLLPLEQSNERWQELALNDYLDRETDLTPLVSELPLDVVKRVLRIMAQERDQEPELDRAALLTALLHRIREMDMRERFIILRDYLSDCADQGRPKLLLDISVLAPLLADLGGKETITQIYHAARRVSQWWP